MQERYLEYRGELGKKSFNLLKIRDFLLCLFLILIFSVPRTLQGGKILLLGSLLLFLILSKGVKTSYFKIIIIYGILFLPPFIVGLINNNSSEFIFNVIRISFIFPSLLLLILQQFTYSQLSIILERGALIATVIILVIFSSSVLNAFNLFPYNINQYFYPDEGFVGIHEGYLHVVNSSLSYLIFLVPILFYNIKFSLRNYKVYLFFIILIVAIVSGRRILLLPFIIIIIVNFKQIILPMIVLFCLSFFFINKETYAEFSFEKIIARFQDALEEKGDSAVRGEQTQFLYTYIKERPIEGYGLGAYMKDYIRNLEMPFAYEKTFHYQFFSMGIPIAFLHLLFYAFFLYLAAISNVGSNNIRFRNSLVVSTICLLIASNTNPYWLSSFDYCLPLAIILRYAQGSKLFFKSKTNTVENTLMSKI